MNSLITILARRDSKRLPGKNTKLFNGRPLISWTLQQADTARLLIGADIIISTDDVEIIDKYINNYQIFYRYEHAGDAANKLDAIRYTVKQAETANQKEYSAVIDLDVTNPCRTAGDIREAYKLLQGNLSVVSVVPARRIPGWNSFPVGRNETGGHELRWLDLNASIYVYSRDFINGNYDHPITGVTKGYLMPEYSRFDIDSDIDFQVAEMLHRKYYLCSNE